MNKNQKKAWQEAEINFVLFETNDIITSSVIEDDDYEGELDIIY